MQNEAISNSIIIGVDIAKDTFEVAFISASDKSASDGSVLKRSSYTNSRAGHRAFIEAAGADQETHHGEVHVVMEATGNYHLRLSKALARAGLRQSIINPLQVKRFAQMKLRRVKTDKSDAVLLAQYGREQEPGEDAPPSVAQAKIKQIATLIDHLTKQRTALKNQQHASDQLPDGATVCEEVLGEQLAGLDKNINKLKKEQERLASEQFTHVKQLAESVKGVGPRTACALIGYAGDLRGFSSHKQLAAFMGLNPVVRESGTWKGRSTISKQGHARLRTLFFMGAQSARLHNRACRALYERIRAKGKAKKVALIAVANKLVKQVFAVIKNQTMFDNTRYQNKSLAA